MFYSEHPITYNRDKGSWFVPLDFLFVRSTNRSVQLPIGGAFKLGNPARPSHDYIVLIAVADTSSQQPNVTWHAWTQPRWRQETAPPPQPKESQLLPSPCAG